MDLLLYLAAHRNRVVTKEEIFEAVWGGVVVEDGALARCISELRKELGDSAREPRFILTVPKRGYRWIAPAEEPEAVAASDPPPRSRVPALAAAAVVLAVVGLVLVGIQLRRSTPVDSALPAVDHPARLAVLGFSSVSELPEVAWVSVALEQMLATELAASDDLRLIAGETVARVRQELSLLAGETLGPRTLGHLRTHLGADLVVVGTYLVLDGETDTTVRIDARVQDTGSGEVVAVLAESAALDRLPEATANLGLRLRGALGLAPASAPPVAIVGTLPEDPEALRSYFEGLWRLRRFEASAAKDLLERSLARDPERPLAHLALSQAWSALGYERNAMEAAERAVELADTLPREQRLWVEANHLALLRRWEEAIERYQALWLFAPSNSDYGLALTTTLLDAARPEEALAALARVRERSGDSRADPRVDLLAARADKLLGNLETALEATTGALDRGSELGASLVVAHALHERATILGTLGRASEAQATLIQAVDAFAAAGDRRSEAQVHASLAAWYLDHGELEAAREHGETALAVFREVGDRAGEATVLGRLAALARHRFGGRPGPLQQQALATYRELRDRVGEASMLHDMAITSAIGRDYAEAEKRFRQALAIYREIGKAESIASVLGNLGKLSMMRLEVAAAAVQLREAEALAEELGIEDLLATVRFNLGYVDLLRAQPTSAAELLAGATALFRKLGNRRMAAAGLNGQGAALMMAGDLDAARACIESGLDLRLEMGKEAGGPGGRQAESQMALARLLLVAGDLEAAEARAREALASAPMMQSYTVLGEVLLEQGRAEEALEAAEQAEERLAENHFFSDSTIRLISLAARARAATGDPETARASLTEALAKVERLGLPLLSMEVRLALAEVEMRSGDQAAGEARLAEIATEARRRGVRLVAGRARTLPARLLPRPAPPW